MEGRSHLVMLILVFIPCVAAELQPELHSASALLQVHAGQRGNTERAPVQVVPRRDLSVSMAQTTAARSNLGLPSSTAQREPAPVQVKPDAPREAISKQEMVEAYKANKLELLEASRTMGRDVIDVSKQARKDEVAAAPPPMPTAVLDALDEASQVELLKKLDDNAKKGTKKKEENQNEKETDNTQNDPPDRFSTNMDRAVDAAMACVRVTPDAKLDRKTAYPKDAQAHLEELLQATEEFRKVHISEHIPKWHGPYLENGWIDAFKDKPLSAFGPYVPLFVPWTDVMVKNHRGKRNEKSPGEYTPLDLCAVLNSKLRDDVMYVTVSQTASGLPRCLRERKTDNIVVLSGGGVGNVPIPLLPGKEPLAMETKKDDRVFWMGNAGAGGVRQTAINAFESKLGDLFNTGDGEYDDFDHTVQNSAFVFAPRGFGRTSFRMYETLQAGSVPIYTWTETEWLPYKGHIDWLSADNDHAEGLAEKVKSILDPKNKDKKVKLLKQVSDNRNLFTMEGVMEQVGLFMSDPAKSKLSCSAKVEMPCKNLMASQLLHSELC